MASVSSATNSLDSLYNTYGKSNTITGLASGMDTETMIEQAVSGYQKKIEALQQKQTMIQWKQAEMRSFITMLSGLNSNYISYRSKTNLFSPSFFTSALTTTVLGANADKISASGVGNSDVAINSVTKLATAATYQVDAAGLFGGADGTGKEIEWGGMDLSYYANQDVTVTLDGVSKSIRIGDLGRITNTKDLAAALQDKLNKAFGEGRVTVENASGALKFSTAEGSTVKAESGAAMLGLGRGVMNYVDTTRTTVVDALGIEKWNDFYFYNDKAYTEQDGVLVDQDGNALALEINGAKITFSSQTTIAGLISNINQSDAGVTASYSQLTNKLTFTSRETGVGGRIDFGGELGERFHPDNSPYKTDLSSVFGDIEWDEDGEASVWLTVDNTRREIIVNKNDTMEELINKIDNLQGGFFKGILTYDPASGTYGSDEKWAGVTASLKLSDSETNIPISELTGRLNPAFTAGQDAELDVTINGERMTLRRASNTFELDGMSITLKDTFNVDEDGNPIEGEAVTFSSKIDTENIVSAVKNFVEDYNTLMKAIRDAYTTQPLEKNSSTHTKYEPLTDSEKEGLSDKTIEEYEEKAKTGMFFMDSDLSGLYSRLNSILTANRGILAGIGISIQYDSESRTNSLAVDEEALTAALEEDVNKVSAVFAGEDGVMAEVQSVVDDYASTSIGNYGILVRKAGAAESAISQRDSVYQKEIESLENQIDKWKDKLGTKIDYYSRQFSLLEQLMSTYNTQSSMLMSMMGGY